MRPGTCVTQDFSLFPGTQAENHIVQRHEGEVVSMERLGLTCVVHMFPISEYPLWRIHIHPGKGLERLLWPGLRGTLRAA